MARARGRGRRDLKSEINIEQSIVTERCIEEQVVAEVSSRFKANPKTVFLIGGAKDVPYDEIIKALNLLHSAGVKSVGLMTQPI